MNKSYEELMNLKTYEERYEYLKTNSIVGAETVGEFRHLQQVFYNSKEWRVTRRNIIVRDNGYDIGHPDFTITGIIIVHHINPISIDDLIEVSKKLTDPNNLICVSEMTHKAIHYGTADLIQKPFMVRVKNDTCPWKGRKDNEQKRNQRTCKNDRYNITI